MVRTKTADTPAQTQTPPDAEVTAMVPAQPQAAPLAATAVQTITSSAPRNLAAALATAQQRCRAVSHDRDNKHHGYRYASAEAVITEAKQALAETGLALVPIEQALDRTPDGGYELCRRFLLLHESGESLVMSCAWPVICEKGRPVDKATAISSTASLAYMLRDLLLMPRVPKREELAGRNDTTRDRPANRVSQPSPTGQAPAEQPQKPIGERFVAKLLRREAELVKEEVCAAGELMKHVLATAEQINEALAEDERYPLKLEAYSEAQVTEAATWIKTFEEQGRKAVESRKESQRELTAEEEQAIATLLGRKKKRLLDVAKTAGCPNNVKLSGLTFGQFRLLMAYLEKLPDAEKPAAQSAQQPAPAA